MNKDLSGEIREFAHLWGGFRASRVVLTANNFAIFEHLKRPKTAVELAGTISTDPRATEILLDAVTSIGLLRKAGSRYWNTAAAKRFLLKDSPSYQGDMLRHADSLWKSWSGLDDVVKTGLPNRTTSRDHQSFILAMHNNAAFRAQDVIKAMDLRGVKKALDLGGGPGTYSMALAKKGISVTLFDLPDTVDIARDLIQKSRIKNIDFISGDFHSDNFGKGYDLVFISQIFHSLSIDENLTLLEKSNSALNPEGRISIQEFFLEKSRAFPVAGALFSVNMLVNTSSGRCYSPQEMKTWLIQTGFKNIKTRTVNDTVLMSAKKG